MKRIGIVAAVAALALYAGAAQAQTIKVGIAGPMTGSLAKFGEQLKKGADQAVADINAAGGVNGKKLELEIGDDACDEKQAVQVANKLVVDKVAAVIGHFCSGSSIPASDVYKEANILEITPASTNPKFTERGYTNVFRTCGRDDVQGAVVGAYIVKNMKNKHIAVLNDKSAYGKGVADETVKAMKKGGMKPTLYEAYNKGDKDFTALISKMKQAKIDVIVLGGYHDEGGLIIRQARDQGLKAQMIGFDSLVTEEFYTIAGPASEGVLMTFAPDPSADPKNKALVDKFTAAGYNPEGYTLFSYAALQVWAEAANKAKSIATAKVAAALRSGTYNSAVGPLRFNAKGDIVNPEYVFYEWKGGKYAQVKK